MKYAQILNNKVHWIFVADKKPKFAPNIVLVDISDNIEVQEGWDYNERTGEFTRPDIKEVPTPDIKEVPTPELFENQALMDYLIDLDFRLLMVELEK